MTDAELQAVLLDVRPRPEPAWAARLDSQVERGFPVAAARPRGRPPEGRVPALAAGFACAVLLVVVIGLSGTHRATGGDGSSSGGGGGGGGVAGSEARKAAPVPGPT